MHFFLLSFVSFSIQIISVVRCQVDYFIKLFVIIFPTVTMQTATIGHSMGFFSFFVMVIEIGSHIVKLI